MPGLVDTCDAEWMQRLLLRAVSEGWCTRINCGTCGSQDFRLALGLIELRSGASPIYHNFDRETAASAVMALRNCSLPVEGDLPFDAAARWVIYQVWRSQGDALLTSLDGSWAGSILGGMRAHALYREQARQFHIARQGVKKRDWKE